MPAQLILEFHGIGSPHGGVTDKNEPMYWLSRETFRFTASGDCRNS